jgi:hypothetical protein
LRAAAAAVADTSPESRARLERHQRAELVIFSLGLRKPAPDQPDYPPAAVFWVTEIVPYHGHRQAQMSLAGAKRPPSVQLLATAIVEHLETLGLTAPGKRALYAVMLAAEVLPALPIKWRLNGRAVLQFLERDLSWTDLVRLVRDTDEV